MSNTESKINTHAWVEQSKASPSTYRQRRAIEIVLRAIAISDPYAKVFMLKGGILMGLAYGSPRLTADIDFTADFEPTNKTPEEIKENLERYMPPAAAQLGYTGVKLKVLTVRGLPKKFYPDADAPAIKVKIGYAEKNTKSEHALERGVGEQIDIDISFKEPGKSIQILNFSDGESIYAYSLHELIAEKFRSAIQQPIRKRNRRQDIYDLRWLIEHNEIMHDDRNIILNNIISQCRARDIEANSTSMENPEVKARAAADWSTMNLEVDELPPFEESFECITEFYRSLPWAE